MSDQNDLFPEALESVEVTTDDQEDLEFLDELEEDVPAGFENLVKLRTSSCSPTYIPVEEPVTIHTLLDIAQLKATMGTAFWVGGVAVGAETFEVGLGAEVVVVGSVKGA
jgi:hypothetical protein